MRTRFIIPLVLMSLVSFPSWGLSMSELVKREGVYYKKFSDTPFTGEVAGRYQGKVKNGKLDGYWVGYHENGQLSSKGDYTNGLRNGYQVRYWDNGQL